MNTSGTYNTFNQNDDDGENGVHGENGEHGENVDEENGDEENVDEENVDEENGNDEDQAKSIVFRKLPHSLSMQEKIELTVSLHDANYFLNATEAELKKVDKRIRPLQKVTKKHLDYIRPTKDLDNNKFTTLIKVKHAARDLFKSPAAKENGAEYKENLATHSTQVVDGKNKRVVTKRKERICESTNDQIELEVFIERVKDKLKEKSTLDM